MKTEGKSFLTSLLKYMHAIEYKMRAQGYWEYKFRI